MKLTEKIQGKIFVMNAFAGGKEIEKLGLHPQSEWIKDPNPIWAWNCVDYRVYVKHTYAVGDWITPLVRDHNKSIWRITQVDNLDNGNIQIHYDHKGVIPSDMIKLWEPLIDEWCFDEAYMEVFQFNRDTYKKRCKSDLRPVEFVATLNDS